MKHWLAQQCVSLPALPGFPANREFYREFFKNRGFCHPETATNGAVTKQKSHIPYPPEQGIFSAKQGTVRQKQGRRLSSAGADRTRRKERFAARQAQHSAGN
jgi:hypothetical protein